MTLLTAIVDADVPLIDGGGPDEAGAVDITQALQDKLATHRTVHLGRGYFKMAPDVLPVITAPVRVVSSHGPYPNDGGTQIGIEDPGAGDGRAFSVATVGCRFEGFRAIDQTGAGNKAASLIYVNGGTPAERRRFNLFRDLRGWGLKSLIHLDGAAYFWAIENCRPASCASGFLCTAQAGEGPNRGWFINNLTEGCDRGYDIQAGDTIEAYGNQSQNDNLGLFSAVNDLQWMGGTFEAPGSVAYQIDPAAVSNCLIGHIVANGMTTVDAGDGSVICPRSRPWELRAMTYRHRDVDASGGSWTPYMGPALVQELRLSVLSGALTINNPTDDWPIGQELRVWIEADINGPYNIAWGSHYNGLLPGMIDGGKCGLLTLRKRATGKIDLVAGHLGIDA